MGDVSGAKTAKLEVNWQSSKPIKENDDGKYLLNIKQKIRIFTYRDGVEQNIHDEFSENGKVALRLFPDNLYFLKINAVLEDHNFADIEPSKLDSEAFETEIKAVRRFVDAEVQTEEAIDTTASADDDEYEALNVEETRVESLPEDTITPVEKAPRRSVKRKTFRKSSFGKRKAPPPKLEEDPPVQDEADAAKEFYLDVKPEEDEDLPLIEETSEVASELVNSCCQVCGDSFDSKRKLYKHMRTVHDNETNLNCADCSKFFGDVTKLIRHLKIHETAKIFKCTVCHMTFNGVRKFNSHVITHKGKKPYSCDICGKSFSRKQVVTIHKLTHSGVKEHTCEICGHSCSTAGALKSHKQTHGDEKPFVCLICGHSFKHLSGLTQHKLKHTNERRHCCEVCGMSFKRHEHLKDHQRIHTGEKPYRCDECGRTFAHRTPYRRHLLIHTGEKPFGCDMCDRRFIQLSHLKTHTKTHLKLLKPDDATALIKHEMPLLPTAFQ